MTHKHKWQFVERWTDSKYVHTGFFSADCYIRTVLEFVCECGKEKTIRKRWRKGI